MLRAAAMTLGKTELDRLGKGRFNRLYDIVSAKRHRPEPKQAQQQPSSEGARADLPQHKES